MTATMTATTAQLKQQSEVGSHRDLAENISFQAFINCYIREVYSGEFLDYSQFSLEFKALADEHENCSAIVLDYPSESIKIILVLGYVSRVGRHQVVRAYTYTQGDWVAERFWTLLIFLIKDIYENRVVVSEQGKQKQLEITSRLVDSVQNIQRYLGFWSERKLPEKLDFIMAEQVSFAGHWLHPSPKSKQGCLDWQQPLYCPEYAASFQLVLFAIDAQYIEQGSSDMAPASEIIDSLFDRKALARQGMISPGQVLIPVHPLQAQWLAAQSHCQALQNEKKLVNLGLQGPYFSAYLFYANGL